MRHAFYYLLLFLPFFWCMSVIESSLNMLWKMNLTESLYGESVVVFAHEICYNGLPIHTHQIDQHGTLHFLIIQRLLLQLL